MSRRARTEDIEDGEQCVRCLRFTYDPHGECRICGFRLHEEEDW